MLSRRDFSTLLTGSAISALMPLGGLSALAAGNARKLADAAVNELRATFGPDTLEDDRYHPSEREGRILKRNIAYVLRYFKSEYVIQPYRDHYTDQWYQSSNWEKNHTLYCPCCYIILAYLCRGTSLELMFREQIVSRYQFSWHYEVTSDQFGPSRFYTVDEYSRLRILRKVEGRYVLSQKYYGWLYHEDNRYIALSPRGQKFYGVSPLDYDVTPRFVPA